MNQEKCYEALKTEEALLIYQQKMASFNEQFCQFMMSGEDFTLRMEIHGNKGRLIHHRVGTDSFGRPEQKREIN